MCNRHKERLLGRRGYRNIEELVRSGEYIPEVEGMGSVAVLEEIGLKKNLNASRPSEHHPVRGGNVKMFRWDHRLQKKQNLFMAFKLLLFHRFGTQGMYEMIWMGAGDLSLLI